MHSSLSRYDYFLWCAYHMCTCDIICWGLNMYYSLLSVLSCAVNEKSGNQTKILIIRKKWIINFWYVQLVSKIYFIYLFLLFV